MDPIRIGNFSSSEIFNLMKVAKDKVSFGEPALGYILKKKRERRLGIEMDLQSTDRATTWGKALEGYVFKEHIEMDYVFSSQETTVHPSGMFVGSKDMKKACTVSDIKCPFTRNSFCNLVEIIEKGDTEYFKEENPQYYYQGVSNSILENTPYAEIVVFMPYIKEFSKILAHFEDIDDFELQKSIQWVISADPSQVPHLPNDSGYNNLYRFRYEVPQKDKDLLLSKIEAAYKILTA